MPTSYIRGSGADSEVEIVYKEGSRSTVSYEIKSITGATSGADYSSCIGELANCYTATIPISVAENLIVVVGSANAN